MAGLDFGPFQNLVDLQMATPFFGIANGARRFPAHIQSVNIANGPGFTMAYGQFKQGISPADNSYIRTHTSRANNEDAPFVVGSGTVTGPNSDGVMAVSFSHTGRPTFGIYTDPPVDVLSWSHTASTASITFLQVEGISAGDTVTVHSGTQLESPWHDPALTGLTKAFDLAGQSYYGSSVENEASATQFPDAVAAMRRAAGYWIAQESAVFAASSTSGTVTAASDDLGRYAQYSLGRQHSCANNVNDWATNTGIGSVTPTAPGKWSGLSVIMSGPASYSVYLGYYRMRASAFGGSANINARMTISPGLHNYVPSESSGELFIDGVSELTWDYGISLGNQSVEIGEQEKNLSLWDYVSTALTAEGDALFTSVSSPGSSSLQFGRKDTNRLFTGGRYELIVAADGLTYIRVYLTSYLFPASSSTAEETLVLDQPLPQRSDTSDGIVVNSTWNKGIYFTSTTGRESVEVNHTMQDTVPHISDEKQYIGIGSSGYDYYYINGIGEITDSRQYQG